MTEVNRGVASPIGAALGRVPSGIFILTARSAQQATGFLASWVQQAGFDPPMLTVAVQLNRFVGDWISRSGRFTICQVASGHKHLLRHFGRGFPPDANAFDGLAIRDQAAGGPVLADALAWLDAQVVGQIDSGDHRVFLARVVGGEVLDHQAEPMTHVRRNGFHY